MARADEQRFVYYDSDLNIEAYNLSGIVQKFPNHFHDYYVIGFIEGGRRRMHCKSKYYNLSSGDLILFNPGDNHFCEPVDGEPLDYRAVNIKPETIIKAVYEITGEKYIPSFTQNVVYNCDITLLISILYDSIVERRSAIEKEEAFLFLIENVLKEYSKPAEKIVDKKASSQIAYVCKYIEKHYCENITLDDLVVMTSFSKSYFLRTFTKEIGVSPYRYIQNIRLDVTKKLLENGVPPIEAANLAGFSDQSHFTNFFKEFIGLTPKQYQRIFTDTNKEEKSNGNGNRKQKMRDGY